MVIRRSALVVVVLGLLAISAQAVFAKELGRVVISGPGLKTPIEITDVTLASQLGPGRLDNFEAQILKPPANPGENFYTIDRGYIDETGKVFTYDHLRYYPDAGGGQSAIFYVGMDGGESSNEGLWFRTSATGEKVLLEQLADHGVTFGAAAEAAAAAPAEPVVEAAPVEAAPAVSAPLVTGGVALLLLAIGAELALARSRAQKARG